MIIPRIYCTSLKPGASIPLEAMRHFPPPGSDFPPIFEKFSDSVENFKNFTFPEKFLNFHSPKFLMTFFKSSTTNFEFLPYFPCFNAFPPRFRENYYFPPTFKNFPPVLEKITCFFYILVYFVSPYFDHDAFMHHPMHVLDAPASSLVMTGACLLTSSDMVELCRQ